MAPSRNVALTATEGHTGHLIAELLLSDADFKNHLNSVTCLTMNPSHANNEALKKLGADIVEMVPGKPDELVDSLKKNKVDTFCLIPPATETKVELCEELVEGAKKAGVQNMLLISSAGCDLAERDKQPRLREFVDIESLVLNAKGDAENPLGHSPCVIRAGIYAETILLYNEQARNSGKLPIPLGPTHKYAPVALGDVAQVAAHVLTGEGPHGFNDKHRGQLMTLTGPMLMAGNEVAEAASQALGVKLEYEDIDEKEAAKLLDDHSELDPAEKQYLLEFYSLVREGKTNYVSTTAFRDVTGGQPTEPNEFFGLYEGEFKPKRRKVEKSSPKKEKVSKSESSPTKKEQQKAEKVAKEQTKETKETKEKDEKEEK
ncbi:NAD(P)-binding protein [Ascobolus immersus RN42]|uniref:NAD(P)-binding protein n=1 Tax=Ascobolus immersus RN42 TaxID=1160509 RepID=A0A3N4ILI3_ASCIM|nr:NAD(P)-binding protein [Ascobolus immersus RN42]